MNKLLVGDAANQVLPGKCERLKLGNYIRQLQGNTDLTWEL